MGCGGSSLNPYDNPKILAWKPQFEALQFNTDTITKIYQIYRKIDVDDSGSIDVYELLTFFDMEGTKFQARVFTILDRDRSGYTIYFILIML